MSEKEIVGKGLKLKFVGTFDLEDLYRKMKFWLDFKGYGDEKDGFNEDNYTERIKPGGKQIEIKWTCKNEVSAYCTAVLEITFFILGVTPVEVEKEGKTVKLKKADIELRFSAYLIVNANDKWPDDSFTNKLYKKYMMKKNIDEYKIDLYDDLYDMMDEVKNYLELYQF
ncbi:MAG: hypothetical protein WC413_01090 [Candidatus Nanoarchaeia archaeon]